MRLSAFLGLVACLAVRSGASPVGWSPDGKQLAAVGRAGVAIAPADGGAPWVLVAPGGRCPAWSPDGSALLYGVTAGDKTDAWLYDLKQKLSRKVAADVGPPYAWREDSKRFVGFVKVPDGAVEAVWFNISDNGVTQRRALPARSVMENNEDVAWLPATDDIAFVGRDGASADVYTVEAGDVTRITRTGDVIGFALASGGKELVWARRGPNLKYILTSVYALSLDTRSSRRLPLPDRIAALNPDPRHAPAAVGRAALASTGGALAIAAALLGSNGAAVAVCCVVRMDGSSSRIVRKALGSLDRLAFAWSPDGSRLAVHDGSVAVVALDGGAARLPALP